MTTPPLRPRYPPAMPTLYEAAILAARGRSEGREPPEAIPVCAHAGCGVKGPIGGTDMGAGNGMCVAHGGRRAEAVTQVCFRCLTRSGPWEPAPRRLRNRRSARA